MRETYVHHAGEGDFTLQEEATTSIQHNAKRNKKQKHKRKRDGELHVFSMNDHFSSNTVDVYFNTDRAIKPEGDEKLVLKPTMSNKRLQGAQLMCFECK